MTQVMVAPPTLGHPEVVAHLVPDPKREGGVPPAHERAPSGRDERSAERRARLLAMRVSRVLEAHPDVLRLLVEHGFTPLANPAMRLALAHTVTLAQALRIRGLDPAAEESLIERLLALGSRGGRS